MNTEIDKMITPCDICGSIKRNWDRGYFVSDKEWKEIIPRIWQDKTLCPWCFVTIAKLTSDKHYEITYFNEDPNCANGVRLRKSN